MSEQEEFFSRKHKQLLKIAIWAKNLAWPALIILALVALSEFLQNAQISNNFSAEHGANSLSQLFQEDPAQVTRLVVLLPLSTLLNGVAYYFVLKGISLGLNMIVETDINYREKKNEGGAK